MSDYEKYIESIKGFGRISVEREKELSVIIQNEESSQAEKDRAIKEFVEANMFLVVSRALKVYGMVKGYGHSLMDLIAEGNVGLFKAAGKYTTVGKNGAVFGTYATCLIDRHIRRFVSLDRLIHVPYHNFPIIAKIKKIEEEYGDEITDEIIMEELGISESVLDALRLPTVNRTIFLEDTSCFDDGESSWIDTLEDKSSSSPDKKIHLDTLKGHIDKYIDRLTPQEQRAIRIMYFSGDVLTLENVAKQMGITRERVRQLKVKALRVLRRYMEVEWKIENAKCAEAETEEYESGVTDIADMAESRSFGNLREGGTWSYMGVKGIERVVGDFKAEQKKRERVAKKIIRNFSFE